MGGWPEADADRRTAHEMYVGRLRDALAAAGYTAELIEDIRHRPAVRLADPDDPRVSLTVWCAPRGGHPYFEFARGLPIARVDDIDDAVAELRAVVGPAGPHRRPA